MVARVQAHNESLKAALATHGEFVIDPKSPTTKAANEDFDKKMAEMMERHGLDKPANEVSREQMEAFEKEMRAMGSDSEGGSPWLLAGTEHERGAPNAADG